ncbi:hypothetical protein Q1695_015371 [Nippostrongylus brasiliensis]|nr:hypothetical protein Q1695_015371 [Nippostrongylus brasiliensis]
MAISKSSQKARSASQVHPNPQPGPLTSSSHILDGDCTRLLRQIRNILVDKAPEALPLLEQLVHVTMFADDVRIYGVFEDNSASLVQSVLQLAVTKLSEFVASGRNSDNLRLLTSGTPQPPVRLGPGHRRRARASHTLLPWSRISRNDALRLLFDADRTINLTEDEREEYRIAERDNCGATKQALSIMFRVRSSSLL